MKKFLLCILTALLVAFPVNVAATSNKIYLCGIVDSDGGDRTSWQTQAESWMSRIPNATIYKKTAFSNTNLSSYLQSSKIFVIHTHGSATALKCVNSVGSISYLNKSTIDNYSSTALSSLNLAFIGACESGKGTSNLVTSIYSKGADCVIGYKLSVATQANYYMIREFCSAIGAGYTIASALTYADNRVLTLYCASGNTDFRLVKGSTSQSFATYTSTLENPRSYGEDIEVIRNKTGEIIGFFDYSLSEYGIPSQTTITIESVNQIIEENGYQKTKEKYAEETGNTTFVYNKYLGDIKTSDMIFYTTNKKGELISFGQPNRNLFDDCKYLSDSISSSISYLEDIFKNQKRTYDITDMILIKEKDSPMIRLTVKTINGNESVLEDYFFDYYDGRLILA